MSKTILQQLDQLGQSVWLDYISRAMLENGQLRESISQGLRGLTSNPSIFNQVISKANDYDEKIISHKKQGRSTFEIYDELTIKDIQDAADHFKDVYISSDGLDGYVSLEINPQIADQTTAQAREGVRLYQKVNRPNVMIKVPSTPEGFTVVEELIAQGINVNVTLIFSLAQYVKTAESYIKGLKRYAATGGDLSRVRSVASVFISRIDSAIDKILDEKIASHDGDVAVLQQLKGKAAVANSRIIYQEFEKIFARDDFKALAARGANIQRVLWGSTSTKSPVYSDIKYVTGLIAKNTVNTIPEATLKAFIDHGTVVDAFATYNSVQAQATIDALAANGIDIKRVCQKLLDDGVTAFVTAFDELLVSIEKKAEALVTK